MSCDADIEAAFEWAEQLVAKQQQALFAFDQFYDGLRNNRPDDGEPFIARGMADAPSKIDAAIRGLEQVLRGKPATFEDLIPLVEEAVTPHADPIPCADCHTLTALEAAPLWGTQLLKSLRMIPDWEDPPNWGGQFFDHQHFRTYWRVCKSAAKKIKPLSEERLSWFEAKLRAEWLAVPVIVEEAEADGVTAADFSPDDLADVREAIRSAGMDAPPKTVLNKLRALRDGRGMRAKTFYAVLNHLNGEGEYRGKRETSRKLPGSN